MAVLPIEDRQRIWRALMRYWSNEQEPIDASKAELQTLINETDIWMDDNRSSYLAALSSNNLTGAQIAWIFGCAALMRKGDSAAALGRLLGVEVD